MWKKRFLSIAMLSAMFGFFDFFIIHAQIDGVTHATTETYGDINLDRINSIAVVKGYYDNYLYCFIAPSDGDVFYRRQTSLGTKGTYNDPYTWEAAWHAVSSSGVYIEGSPLAAGVNYDNRIYVFAVDWQTKLMYAKQTNQSAGSGFDSWTSPYSGGGSALARISSS